MESKTPQFDALLDKIIDDLVPHARDCIQKGMMPYCEGSFDITQEDIDFLKMLRVPPPKCCPTCRTIRRLAFVNTAFLYKHENNAPNKSGNIISFVPPASPFTVYDVASYQTMFDPYNYATTYDDKRSFFDQLYDLRIKVPQPAIIRDPSNINSEYSINGRNSKNCYWVSGVWNSEDVWYSNSTFDSREIMDCHRVRNCERCYQSVITWGSYNSSYLYFSNDCIDSSMLYDCRNCQNCFGCVNLRNKQYCYFNEQLSKEGYKKKLEDAHFESRNSRKALIEKFWEFVRSQPIRAARVENSKDIIGVDALDSKNCHHVINCERSEHGRYLLSVVGNKDSMDVHTSGASEKLYETSAVGSKCSNVKFTFASKFITDSEFLINCRTCSNCFGCIGMENKSYCIFNKQYSPEDYHPELDRIKKIMIERGEYGEFLPYRLSTFAYNGSSAELAFPLPKESYEKLGLLYQPEIEIDLVNATTLSGEEIPDTISDAPDDILAKVIVCSETSRPFRITATELEFYKRQNIPIPDVHPLVRIRNRFSYLGNRLVNRATCFSCKKDIDSMYDPKDNLILYCEECFKKEVY